MEDMLEDTMPDEGTGLTSGATYKPDIPEGFEISARTPQVQPQSRALVLQAAPLPCFAAK